jgi:hypothetical protein
MTFRLPPSRYPEHIKNTGFRVALRLHGMTNNNYSKVSIPTRLLLKMFIITHQNIARFLVDIFIALRVFLINDDYSKKRNSDVLKYRLNIHLKLAQHALRCEKKNPKLLSVPTLQSL